MNDATKAANKRRWRIWITLSELVGVLALVIAGLNFWTSRRDHADEVRRESAAERRQDEADRQAAARTAFVLTARTAADGARLEFQPMSSDQAVQNERFVFPAALADHAVDTVQPRLQRDWLDKGLRQAVGAARRAKAAGPTGEGEAPVGVVSTYVENGEVREDRSIYRLAYAWKTPLLGGPKFTLEGATLVRRGLKGDLQRQVESMWQAQHPDAPDSPDAGKKG